MIDDWGEIAKILLSRILQFKAGIERWNDIDSAEAHAGNHSEWTNFPFYPLHT